MPTSQELPDVHTRVDLDRHDGQAVAVVGSYAAVARPRKGPPDPEAPGIFRLAKPGDLAAIAQQAGLLPLADEEVTAEVAFPSARDYYTSLMDLAAPLQNLLATLSASQKSEAEHRIIQAAGSYQRGAGIALPMTVRFVTARKPL